MSEKRKISIRKIIQTLVTILVVTGCTMAILSADSMQNNRKVRSVYVHIRNSDKVHFVDNAQVMEMLFSDRHIEPKNTKLSQLDVHKMESIVRTSPWIGDAQVYIDNERNVHIYVTQRVPVARLFEENGNSYYIDTALRTMPVSTSYVHYTPIVTGTPQLRDDSLGRAKKGEILALVNYVTKHPFWNAQIAQIVAGDNKNFELIPVLGKQRILLGDTSRMAEKFDNLFAFYQQVFNKVGWDKYETVDLRYKDQVVASPTIKWKIPVDHALSNINWVKAVLEAGNKNEKDESAITDSTAQPAVAITPQPATAPAPKPAAPVKPITVASAAIKPKPNAFSGSAKPKPAVAIKPKPKPAIAAKKTTAKPIVSSKPKPAIKKETKLVKKETKPAKKAVKKPEKKATSPPKKETNRKAEKTSKKITPKPRKNATNH